MEAATAVDILVDFETASDGDTLTAARVNAATIGTGLGSWRMYAHAVEDATPSNPFEIDTGSEYDSPWPMVVNQTKRSDYGHTRGLRQHLDWDETYVRAAFSANHDNVTVGWWYKTTVNGSSPSFAQLDLVQIEGATGDFAVFQVRDNNPPYMNAHSSAGISGTHISFSADTWYWINLRYNRSGNCTVKVYDTTLTQVGSTSSIGQSAQQASAILFGRTDGHSDISNAKYHYWDDLVIDFNGADPVLPTRNVFYVRTDGADSNDGAADVADTTGTSGQAWLTIGQAASTMTPGDVTYVRTGTYAERFTETTDGYYGARIQYVGHGGVVTTRGWHLNGANYVDVVGIKGTHSDNQGGYTGIYCVELTSATGSRILGGPDNYGLIDRTDESAVNLNGNTDIIFRGMEISRPDWDAQPDNLYACFRGGSGAGQASTGTRIEWCNLHRAGDYVLPNGSGWRIRNNIMGPDNGQSAAAHIDGVQPNNTTTDSVFEGIWFASNQSSDNHFFLNQLEASDGWWIRRNIMHLSKGYMDWSEGDNHRWYHNVWANTYDYYVSNTQVFCSGGNSTGNFSRNNIIYRAVGTGSTTFWNGSITVDKDYDISYSSGDLGEANDIHNTDPQFVDSDLDYRTQVGSPARDAAGALTLANGAGSSATTLILDAPMFFVGDLVRVGSTTVRVTAATYSTATYTITPAATWSDNAVCRLVTPQGVVMDDIGAHEDDADHSTRTATYTVSGGVYTLTVNFPWSMIEVFEDGIPTIEINGYETATYTSQSGGACRFIVRPWDASANLGTEATLYSSSVSSGLSGGVTISGGATFQ